MHSGFPPIVSTGRLCLYKNYKNKYEQMLCQEQHKKTPQENIALHLSHGFEEWMCKSYFKPNRLNSENFRRIEIEQNWEHYTFKDTSILQVMLTKECDRHRILVRPSWVLPKLYKGEDQYHGWTWANLWNYYGKPSSYATEILGPIEF